MLTTNSIAIFLILEVKNVANHCIRISELRINILLKLHSCFLLQVQKIISLLAKKKIFTEVLQGHFISAEAIIFIRKSKSAVWRAFTILELFTHTNPSEKLWLQEGKLVRNNIGLYPASRKYVLLGITQAYLPTNASFITPHNEIMFPVEKQATWKVLCMK